MYMYIEDLNPYVLNVFDKISIKSHRHWWKVAAMLKRCVDEVAPIDVWKP